MTEDDEDIDTILKLSWGCMVVGLIGFAAIVFIIAAAIKWIIA